MSSFMLPKAQQKRQQQAPGIPGSQQRSSWQAPPVQAGTPPAVDPAARRGSAEGDSPIKTPIIGNVENGVFTPNTAEEIKQDDLSKNSAEQVDERKPDASAGSNDFQQQADSLWANMLADYDASLQGKMNQTYADESAAGRRQAEMNAGLGRGMGGGFQAGAAHVALGGMAQRQDVLNQHTKQGLEMKMTYLDRLIKQAEAANDRELARELQAEQDKTALALAGAGVDTTDYTADPNDLEGAADFVRGLEESRTGYNPPDGYTSNRWSMLRGR